MNLYLGTGFESYINNQTFFILNMTETGYVYKRLNDNQPLGTCISQSCLVLWLFCNATCHIEMDIDISSLLILSPGVVHVETYFHYFDIIILDMDKDMIYLTDYYQEANRENDLWTRQITYLEYVKLIKSLQDDNSDQLASIIGHSDMIINSKVSFFDFNTVSSPCHLRTR